MKLEHRSRAPPSAITPSSSITPSPSTAKQWPSCRNSSTWELASARTRPGWSTPRRWWRGDSGGFTSWDARRGHGSYTRPCPHIQYYWMGLWLQRREQEVLRCVINTSEGIINVELPIWQVIYRTCCMKSVSAIPRRHTPDTTCSPPSSGHTSGLSVAIVLQQYLGRLREFIFMIHWMKYDMLSLSVVNLKTKPQDEKVSDCKC